jgi:toxin ParE1/3/4
MAEVKLTPAAERDLENIWRYTADRWSVEQAETYLDSLLDAMEELADNPSRGRSAEDIRPDYRRQNIGAHVIFYKRATYGITVVRVLHQRMDFDEHL